MGRRPAARDAGLRAVSGIAPSSLLGLLLAYTTDLVAIARTILGCGCRGRRLLPGRGRVARELFCSRAAPFGRETARGDVALLWLFWGLL